jgi:hypothetical protein
VRRTSRATATQTDEAPSLPTSPMSPTSVLTYPGTFTSPDSSNDALPSPIIRTVPYALGGNNTARGGPGGLAPEVDRGMPSPMSPVSPLTPTDMFKNSDSSNDALPPPIVRMSWH